MYTYICKYINIFKYMYTRTSCGDFSDIQSVNSEKEMDPSPSSSGIFVHKYKHT